MTYGEWCNGSTTDSDSVCLGSNPSSPANDRRPAPIHAFCFIRTYLRGLAARCARVLIVFTLETKRAPAMPGARCTRGLLCKLHQEMRTRSYTFIDGIRH